MVKISGQRYGSAFIHHNDTLKSTNFTLVRGLQVQFFTSENVEVLAEPQSITEVCRIGVSIGAFTILHSLISDSRCIAPVLMCNHSLKFTTKFTKIVKIGYLTFLHIRGFMHPP